MKGLLITLAVVIIGLSIFTLRITGKMDTEIATLKAQNKALQDTLAAKSLPNDDLKLLGVYQKCFSKLIVEYPECAKNFARIMSDYE